MRRMVISKRRIRTCGGVKLTLIYSVIIDELSSSSLAAGLESYGAGISIVELGEEICIRHITLRMHEIITFTKLLSSNCVTPSTLSDVVYDWICRH